MNLVYSFPKSSYDLPTVINLNYVEERARLSPSAVKGFINIVSKWQIKDKDARELLGGISSTSFYALKKIIINP